MSVGRVTAASASVTSGRSSRGVSQTAGSARCVASGAATLASDLPTNATWVAEVAVRARSARSPIQANGSASAGARSLTSSTDQPSACAASRANQSSGA